MSLEIWPPISAPDLKIKVAQVQERELKWATGQILDVCSDIKHGLDDCYALLAPIDPGSTLVMSTPRIERVKGTITRVGTRIVKAVLNTQLRLMPAQCINISQSAPVHIHALDELHAHLTRAIDLLSATLSPSSNNHDPDTLASTLTEIAHCLTASAALLRGPPPALSDPAWQKSSCSARHFDPPLPPNLSFHIGLQESCIVLWLRVLEPVDAPVHFGRKLGLAIGTVRRLEHDEADLVFRYDPNGRDGAAKSGSGAGNSGPAAGGGEAGDVYVREKVRVDSADPSLISLYSKLGFLGHQLGQARRNLAAVMGDDFDESMS